jgi:glycosyltransferase involved in cell wall biosynthesis
VKIGIDASLASRRGSGTGRYAALLVEWLLALDRENDYFLYFRSSDHEDNPLFPIRGPRITTRITDAPLTLMRIHMNLLLQLARDGVELYHSLGFFLPWLWRGRMVVSIHDIHPVIQRELWGWPGTRAADLVLRAHIPIALRQARRILVLSEYVKQTLCDRYQVAPETILVAPPGTDPLFLLPPAPSEIEAAARLLGSGRFLLYVGALAPHKNVAGLVRAFARLPPRRGTEPVRLVLTGQPVGRYLELTLAPLIRELGLGDRVVLTGYVGDEMLRALYHRAAALVLPSFGEGFGLPVLEAMACGAPVVTSRGTALPETAGDAALYVDPHRPDDIAAAMGRLLEDETLRQDLIARGEKRAATFTWDRTAGQMLRAYREAAAAAR